MNTRFFALTAAVFIFAGTFSACNKAAGNDITESTGEPSNTQTSAVPTTLEPTTENPTTTDPEETTVPEPTVPSPTLISDEPVSEFNFPEEGKRPFAVMVDNEGTKPLPQGGLNKAQLIYEVIVEFGVTRLMALYWNEDPEMIGPVRSSRHYFIEYAMEHDALYVHIGQSPKAEIYLRDYKIQNVNGVLRGHWIFWDISDDPKNWQDTYTSMKKIKDYMTNAKYRFTTEKPLVFTYNESGSELETDKSATDITLKYSYYSCSYEYDLQTRRYRRFREGKAHLERSTDKQLMATNIIVQYVKNYTIKGDKEGRQELDNVGEGKGYFISYGKVIDITWSKESETAATIYKDLNGNAIELNPGQTWVQVVPDTAKVTIK